ncbi:MAG: roadblock/LC7 domain-containing protein [Candidatus Thermoplasmatota archaeon]
MEGNSTYNIRAKDMREVYKLFLPLKECGAEGYVYITRAGATIFSDLPQNISEETFALLSATIMGASEVAYSELKQSLPEKVIISSGKKEMLVCPVNEKSILVVIYQNDGKIYDEVKKIMDRIRMVVK